MSEQLVKVAHTKKVNTTLVSAYGEIEIDQYGCADVPAAMAAKIEAGDYGETWRLMNGKPKKKPTFDPDETKEDVEAQARADAAELQEAIDQAEERKKVAKKSKKKTKKKATKKAAGRKAPKKSSRFAMDY